MPRYPVILVAFRSALNVYRQWFIGALRSTLNFPRFDGHQVKPEGSSAENGRRTHASSWKKQRFGSPRVYGELGSEGDPLQREPRRPADEPGRPALGEAYTFSRQDGLGSRSSNRSKLAGACVDAGMYQPDDVWVADIAYVPTREGWLYLAVVLDLATRIVVDCR